MKHFLKQFYFLILLFVFTNVKAQTLKLDTLKRNDTITISKVKIATAKLKIDKEIKLDSILLKIYHNRNGNITKEYNKFSPKKDEIFFFYGQNFKTRKLEMFFKIGKNLQPIYVKQDFYQKLEIVRVLEHQIFGIDSFSGTTAFSALEKVKFE